MSVLDAALTQRATGGVDCDTALKEAQSAVSTSYPAVFECRAPMSALDRTLTEWHSAMSQTDTALCRKARPMFICDRA